VIGFTSDLNAIFSKTAIAQNRVSALGEPGLSADQTQHDPLGADHAGITSTAAPKAQIPPRPVGRLP
jgi:hypothetical protein